MQMKYLAGVALAAALGPMTASERRMGRYMRAPEGHRQSQGARRGVNPLREQRAQLVAQMRGMLDIAAADTDRDLNAEETTAYDALEAQVATLDQRIAREAGLEAAEAAGAASQGAVARGTQPGRPIRGPEANTEFESMGEFLSAVRFNPNDQRLNFVEGVGTARPDGEIGAELRMDAAPSGGFMVPTQLRSTIMQIDPQDALVRPRAMVIPAGSPPDAAITFGALDQTGANPGNMFGGVQVQWIGEGQQKPETDLSLRQITLTPHEVAGFMSVTDKLLRNWTAAGAVIEQQLRAAVTGAEDYAFYRGDGVSKPLGVLNAGATKFINRATANQVTYVDLVSMVARLLMRGGTSPVWSMPQGVLPQLAFMTDPEGHYIWQANARDGFGGNLLGYPVRWNNRAPGLGAKGDVLLADWSYYVIKDGSGPFVATSEHVKFLTNETVVKIFWNVDGSPWLSAPIKEENGYEVSPFIALDVPA